MSSCQGSWRPCTNTPLSPSSRQRHQYEPGILEENTFRGNVVRRNVVASFPVSPIPGKGASCQNLPLFSENFLRRSPPFFLLDVIRILIFRNGTVSGPGLITSGPGLDDSRTVLNGVGLGNVIGRSVVNGKTILFLAVRVRGR